jgi:RNA polymerase sigma-70 factor, ECF subfamily
MTLGEVYRDHFRFVWRALRRLGVPEADTQDAAQDVFVVVHRKLSDFEGRSQMTTWLFSICLHVARNRRRKAQLRLEVSDEAVLERQADPSPDGEDQLRRREGLALLDSILDEMDLDQRVVLSLFELEGMTGEEIASLLELPLGTVYSRLRLGREAFRQLLERAQARDRFSAARWSGGSPASPPSPPSPPSQPSRSSPSPRSSQPSSSAPHPRGPGQPGSP